MYVTRSHILTKAKGLLQRLANGNLGQQIAVQVLYRVPIISSPTLLHFYFLPHFPFFLIFLILSSIQSCHPFSSFQLFSIGPTLFLFIFLSSLPLSLSDIVSLIPSLFLLLRFCRRGFWKEAATFQ